MEKQKNWFLRHPVWTALIALFLIGFIFNIVAGPETNSSTADSSKMQESSLQARALVFCKAIQSISLDRLKAPATAQFQSCNEAQLSFNESLISVETYVDSQNGFGALLRTKIYAEEENIEGDWMPRYYLLGEDTIYHFTHEELVNYKREGLNNKPQN